jgi:hypothetical protein
LQGTTGLQGLTGSQGLQGLQGSTGPSTTINATDTVAAGTYYPVFVAAAGTNQTARVRSTATAFAFNPGTGEVSATDFNTLSDLSMKINVTGIDHAVEKLRSIRGVHFQYRQSGRASLGVIAQDLEPVLPDLVKPATDGTRSVSYNGLVAVLIEAIKQQQNDIEELRQQIKQLRDLGQ